MRVGSSAGWVFRLGPQHLYPFFQSLHPFISEPRDRNMDQLFPIILHGMDLYSSSFPLMVFFGVFSQLSCKFSFRFRALCFRTSFRCFRYFRTSSYIPVRDHLSFVVHLHLQCALSRVPEQSDFVTCAGDCLLPSAGSHHPALPHPPSLAHITQRCPSLPPPLSCSAWRRCTSWSFC